MFYAYGDDSADEKQERVRAIGVVFGTENMWQSVESKWIELNRGIPFHARDCESDWGDYRDKAHPNEKHAENKKLYKDLVGLIVDSGLGGMGVAIDLKAQKEAFPGGLDFAYYKAFAEILIAINKFSVRTGETAKYKFDIQTAEQFNAAYLYQYFRENEPDMSLYLDCEVSYGPAKECPRLQVGDLMAFEAMKALDNIIGPKKRPTRKSWEALGNTKRFITHCYSADWFIDMKAHQDQLATIVGFTMEDYRKWLVAKNRHDDISTRFFYINLKAREQQREQKEK